MNRYEYDKAVICQHCGHRKGNGMNHAKCSKVLQKQHENDNRRGAQKVISKKNAEYLAATYSGK